MLSIPICASRRYSVLIGTGLIDAAGVEIRKAAAAEKAAVISGESTYKLYGKRLEKSLRSAGFSTVSLTVPHGENAKSLETYGGILEFLSENRITRSDILVALGGGSTGDIAGFAAATYMRGIRYVQMPTTLLAAADSSVGGKTAVNIPSGKNLAGCFWQPSLVLCDTDSLSTLSEKEFRSGCAEIIKYAVIGDAELFDGIEALGIRSRLAEVIGKCVEIKGGIISRDEFDTGERQILNFGHTVGHAVEKCSGFTVPHGQAVAAGMAAISRAACRRGILGCESTERIIALLKKYGLATECPFSAESIYEASLSDKKRLGDSIKLAVPERIGRCAIKEIHVNELIQWLRDGGMA